MIFKTVVARFTSRGIGATVTSGGAILIIVGICIRNETLFFLEKNDEDLGVNMIILGGLIDDLGGRFAIKGFVSHTDEMAVFYVVVDCGVPGGDVGTRVVAGIFGFEEGLDGGNIHGVVIAHDSIGHDIARVVIPSGSGGSLGAR